MGVLGPVLAQHRQGSVQAPAWGTGRQSHAQRRVILQPKHSQGCDEKEVLIFLGDPKGL